MTHTAVLTFVLCCRTIYEKLANAFTEEQAVLYNQRVEEISPNIRYCAYNIGKEGGASSVHRKAILIYLNPGLSDTEATVFWANSTRVLGQFSNGERASFHNSTCGYV